MKPKPEEHLTQKDLWDMVDSLFDSLPDKPHDPNEIVAYYKGQPKNAKEMLEILDQAEREKAK